MTRRSLPVALALSATVALGLTGCADAGAGGDGIQIVASTNVYGDIAERVAGGRATVTSIITNTAQDPHEYEATARDALAVSRADIVVVNGGGYDSFMTDLLAAHDGGADVVDAVLLSGLDPEADIHDHGDEGDDHAHDDAEHDDHAHEDGTDAHAGHTHGALNEHVWYHLGTMQVVAAEIGEHLAERDPANATTYRSNAVEFAAQITGLAVRAGEIAATSTGTGVAITEPVPLYLLQAAGLHNRTPAEFSSAIEEGSDVPVLVLQQVEALVSDGSVALLAYNEQTVGPQTLAVLEAATSAELPVVSFSELLPEGLSYIDWMSANLDAIAAAIGSGAN